MKRLALGFRVLFVLTVWAWLLWALWSYGLEPGPF
jgi:hypothetical protein